MDSVTTESDISLLAFFFKNIHNHFYGQTGSWADNWV